MLHRSEPHPEIQKQLDAARQQLTLFIEHAPAAFAMFDRDMRYVFASQRWKEDLGLNALDVVGLRHYDLFPTLPERWREAHARGLAGERLAASEDSFELNGATEWLRWEIQPWRDVGGVIGGLIIFGERITERKQMEMALKASHKLLEDRVADRTRELAAATASAHLANEQKSAFLSAASHDLRQPLQAASAYLCVIESRADPEVASIATKALRALDAANDILSSLLDLSRLNAGTVSIQVEDFRVDALLERLALQFQANAANKNIRLVRHHSNLSLRTDPRLLERVVANYVANAVRYTTSGTVELGATLHGQDARIYVRDTGIGIAAEHINAIFGEFVQLDNAARTRSQGYGLGLAIAKRVASMIGCPIGVASTIGEGSTFWIDVPITQAAPKHLVLSAPQSTPFQSAAILLVEDDDMVGEATELLLLDEGYKPTRTSSGQRALDIVSDGFRPDVIISDYRLPDCNGADLVAQLRKRLTTNTPAVLLTGDTVASHMQLDRVQVLHKPASASLLRGALGKLEADISPLQP